MNVLSAILHNGFLPLLPVMIWNLVLTSKLPPAYGPKEFDRDIPKTVLIGENAFRFLTFLMALFLENDFRTAAGTAGLTVYGAGCLAYFLSWTLLIVFPGSSWSKSAVGFTAPAFTPLIWLTGMSLMGHRYYFGSFYSPVQFIVPSILFVLLHLAHAVLAYRNWNKKTAGQMKRQRRRS